jgi:tetratricopeptide (TPR) repeat protein
MVLSVSGEARVHSQSAALVGRDAELRVLEEALAHVREKGTLRIVTTMGAAGVGKTRLIEDFLAAHALRVWRGAAREEGAALDVFARVLRARFGITEGMAEETAKTQVREHLSKVLEDRKVGDVCWFLGQILGLDFMDSPVIRAVRSDPAEMTGLRRAVLRHFFEADAGGEPVVLLFDDLQNAHDDSLDLLGHLAETLKAPILLLCVGRTEMMARREDWSKHGAHRHRVIELGPLSADDAARVIRELLVPCGEQDGVDDLVEAACTLAGGNPELLERMVRIFHDIGVLETRAGRCTVHLERLSEVELPLTIEDAVQARIASLSAFERGLLEHAALMGGVFWLGGLLAMARIEARAPDVWSRDAVTDTVRIATTLRELVERDYILKLPDSTFPDDEEYAFKHNLERERLLKLFPRARAIRAHRAVSDWLSFKPHVRTHEEYVGMLAKHREDAGLVVQAAATYLDAAHLARNRYSNARAAEYYLKGLSILRDGVEGSTEEQLRALHHYGDVLQVLGRNAEALDCFNEMLVRAYRLNLKSKGGAAHGRIGRLLRDTGRLTEAEVHLKAALELFEEATDERGIASTIDDLGKLYWLRGDHQEALAATQRALVLRRKLGDRRSIALSLNNLGLVHQDAGQFKAALDAFEQALRIRREIGDLVGVAISLNNLGSVAQDQRDDRRALQLFLEAYEVAKETGDRHRISLVLTNLGATYTRLGDAKKALHYLQQAKTIAEELGDQFGLAEAARGLGKAYLAARDIENARDATERAVEIFREIHSKVQLGVALRTLAEVVAETSDGFARARAHVLASIVIFEELGNDIELARSLRLHSALLRASTDAADLSEADVHAARADAIFAKLEPGSREYW